MTDDHQPVMVDEVLHMLDPRPGGVWIDATLGAGGHTEAILHAVSGEGTVIGVDRDPGALSRAAHNLRVHKRSLRLVRTNFEDIAWVAASQDIDRVDGVLFDVGMSSMQLDAPERGFAYRSDGPLDMRMDPDQPLTAAQIVNTYPVDDLAALFKRFGEERHARPLAQAIDAARRTAPLRTTTQLAQILSEAYPARRRRQHPARRVFQALRIEVNGELRALETALRALPEVLAPGGRAVVLSYHSLEDRLVKKVFGELAGATSTLPGLGRSPATGPLRPLTSGAILPSDAEAERNPRASSARLRAAVRRADRT